MHKESHKGYWGIMQTETGELIDIAYVECHHFSPVMTIHAVINPAIAQPFNHAILRPFKGFELL
jgi:hypothetical protein